MTRTASGLHHSRIWGLDVGLGHNQLNGAIAPGEHTGILQPEPKPAPRKRTPRTRDAVAIESPRVPWLVQHWRELAMLGTVLASVGTFLHESGWLLAPAKESAVRDLETKITDLQRLHTQSDERLVKNVDSVASEVREHRAAIGEIGKTLGRMEGKLDTLKQRRSQ